MLGEAPFFVEHRLVSDALATISSASSTSHASPFIMAADWLGKRPRSFFGADRTTLLV